MNLPNALTVARIATTPLIAGLPLLPSTNARLWAFVLFLAAVNTDWIDGWLARSRKQETDLGRLLDPLADKLLLVGTFVPMYLLARTMPFTTPFGPVGLPLWVVGVILGREVTMTWFRQYLSRRGVIIAPVASAKWKTFLAGFWQGAAYCWFWMMTKAAEQGRPAGMFTTGERVVSGIGTVSMVVAITLTLWSLFIYMRDYGKLLGTKPTT